MENHTTSPEIDLSVDIERHLSQSNLLWRLRASKISIAVQRYKKFLFLIQKYPEEIFVPTKEIDKCWHVHLESPVAYYNDCIRLFGKIIDHNAGFGRQKNEREDWEAKTKKTALFWKMEFNENYGDRFLLKPSVCSNCSNCSN